MDGTEEKTPGKEKIIPHQMIVVLKGDLAERNEYGQMALPRGAFHRIYTIKGDSKEELYKRRDELFNLIKEWQDEHNAERTR